MATVSRFAPRLFTWLGGCRHWGFHDSTLGLFDWSTGARGDNGAGRMGDSMIFEEEDVDKSMKRGGRHGQKYGEGRKTWTKVLRGEEDVDKSMERGGRRGQKY
ncbi:hypothetical protein RRG08_019899 [Elysia crispata]|uniref:Uncharacterized protein n=1 Tax=Elysia crispata TaxID=231223 RepID=A0AAE0YQL7_9GAST|nr:hypothetical protein RRG08_019899 [Elysia crispata]